VDPLGVNFWRRVIVFGDISRVAVYSSALSITSSSKKTAIQFIFSVRENGRQYFKAINRPRNEFCDVLKAEPVESKRKYKYFQYGCGQLSTLKD
jgi:hypothetical protein